MEFSFVGIQGRRERVIGSNRTVGGSSRAAPAPLAGGLHNPFSVKRQGRNAGYIAAAGAFGAVEQLMTPTMAVPSCRSSRGFQNRPSSAGPNT
ncbi:MAG: hypothetical protein JWP25_7681 [Bradyrhizobium sp.]|jgi:hypothetical protein|nr:hypothetical protein [Bradyrhizobium sp.]